MDVSAVTRGLIQMANDMVVAGEPVTIDKIVERHLDLLRAARALGLRWNSIARLMERSDGANGSERKVSAQHLRASYSRALQKNRIVAAYSTLPTVASGQKASDQVQLSTPPRAPSSDRKARSPPDSPDLKSGASSKRSTDPADLSEADLAAARRRLS